MSESKDPSPSDNQIKVEGILELLSNKSGQLLDPKRCGKTSPHDAYVPKELIRRFKLKAGSYITGNAHSNQRHANPKVCFVETVDGMTLDERKKQYKFTELTTISPDEQLHLETSGGPMTTRVIDLFCPIGKGQRGLIVAPPRTGKTTLLHDMASGLKENHPECHLIILLVDERPEEVTDFKRSVDAEIFSSSNDEELPHHLRIADLALERAKRLMETGKDVIVVMDSLTRLSRAYNSAKGGSGRTMSGGLDIRALEKPRQFFSSARNTEEGGSLTIIASALIETGSRMDDLIFQEFKGTGNMEIVLDRKAAEQRLWPAININASGTRKEELLLEADTLEKVRFFRRALASMKPDEATETLLGRMSKTSSNAEFLRLLNG
tara:strand:+ start:27822 stop:28961 length:1140 start_codon:yes stop_codon:yes gene_type:complete